jgi:hypothetical protein
MRRLTEILIVTLVALSLGACSAADFRWWPAHEPPDIDAAPGRPDTLPAEPADADIAITKPKPKDRPSLIPDAQTELLHEANAYFALSPEAQRREFSRAESQYLDDSSDFHLLRLGLYAALTRPERPDDYQHVRNDLRARLMHEEAMSDEDGLRPLAGLVLHMLDEREQLMAQLTSRNEELQRKLDELKAIEQQLRERETTGSIRTFP